MSNSKLVSITHGLNTAQGQETIQSLPQDSGHHMAQSQQDQIKDSTQSKPRKSSNNHREDKPRKPLALTGKQMHFARCIAQGMTKTEAYYEAYDAKNMARQTVNEAACRLSKDSRITARVQQLQSLKDQAFTRSTVGLKDKVLQKLLSFMDNATPQDSAKLRAAELLGKSIGLFKDVVEDGRYEGKSSEELSELLARKLSEFQKEYQDENTDDDDDITIN